MRTQKPSVKKRPLARKTKVNIDPSRRALAALERLKSLLTRTNHSERFGAPASSEELAARHEIAGSALPASYVAAMQMGSAIGEPEELLTAAEMKRAVRTMAKASTDSEKQPYVPFARVRNGSTFYCFNLELRSESLASEGSHTQRHEGHEFEVVEWRDGVVKAVASHFGDWLDAVADQREDILAQAAEIPKSLRDLLDHLGFRFDDPISGRLVTGDVRAIEALLGIERAERIRGATKRLFDSTGKAELVLNLDAFVLSCTLRTGTVMFEAEDVFRWLRTFRDENFFGESDHHPTHDDRVRDLRKAPRELPRIVRGTLEVNAMPAKRHFFCDASGPSPQDFHLLGVGLGDHSTSLILHVVDGDIRAAHTFEQALHGIHAEATGVIWGLSNNGSVVRFEGSGQRSYPLPRASGNLTWWYGIGEYRGRVIVWGTGALLEFDGAAFVPFYPDAKLEKHEAVMAIGISGPYETESELSILVSGDQFGAIARFDGRLWMSIDEAHVVEGDLADYDVWRGIGVLLGRRGQVWRVEGGAPRSLALGKGAPALINDAGALRPTHAVRGFDRVPHDAWRARTCASRARRPQCSGRENSGHRARPAFR
jgi:hypothetical protein